MIAAAVPAAKWAAETQLPLWLIMSGACVGQELGAEIGLIPPTMIPIGHARLYELQLATVPLPADIYIVLPETFALPEEDARRLRERGVGVVPLPADLSLGTAIVYALNFIGASDRDLRILHGDTLIRDLPTGADVLAVAESTDEYAWADVDIEDGNVSRIHTEVGDRGAIHRTAACGYFACSSSTMLVRSIIYAKGDFIAGVSAYANMRDLRAAQVSEWLDFGHLQTFFQSRRTVTTTRIFNEMTVGRIAVRKSSVADGDKIRAEASWLGSAPPSLQVYCSRVLDAGEGPFGPFYETEYEYMLTLSELYLFGAIGKAGWGRIASACTEFLGSCAAIKREGSGDRLLRQLTVEKTVERLERFARETGFDITAPTRLNGRALPCLLTIATDLQAAINLDSGRLENIMHGDFCFSNIFYNSRARRVRVIDPRGYVEAKVTSAYGDLRYDVAKLAHSVIGRYDQILAGRYRCTGTPRTNVSIDFEETPIRAWLRDAFSDIAVDGVTLGSDEVHAIMTGLFLSMLPLHSDRPDRQTAFIANAMRLYAERF